jgi:hypothetical protein
MAQSVRIWLNDDDDDDDDDGTGHRRTSKPDMNAA